MPRQLLILQATSFCNLDCSYCYLPNRHLADTLSLETFKLILERFVSSKHCQESFTVVWHAGEPLAVPKIFYTCSSSILKSTMETYPAKGWSQAVVTNGTLLDEEWCTLFNANKFRVTISIDGPKSLHDARRRY